MRTPVIIVGFNRPTVLERSLSNLAKCQAVEGREIYVYIDGARSIEEKDIVNEVVDVVSHAKERDIPNLKLKLREENYGCQKNICSAIEEVLEKHGSMCLIEDDVLVSRTFLVYMDEALNVYKGDKRIFNINGYRPRYMRIPRCYEHDIYLDLRNHTPGWGIWKDRWDEVRFDLSDWDEFKKSKINLDRLRAAGCDLYAMIERQVSSPVLEAWDVQCTYHMVKNGLFSIAPRYTLTKNIGFGIKSLHCDRYNPVMPTQRYYNFHPKLVRNVQPHQEIMRQIKHVDIPSNRFVRGLRKIHRGLLRFSPQFLEPFDCG